MARGRQIESAPTCPIAEWRAERVVAPIVVKDVNSDFGPLRAGLEICRKALPLGAIRCNMEELRASRGVWDCGREGLETKRMRGRLRTNPAGALAHPT